MNIGETELMGADVSPERFQPMRSVYLSLTVNGADEAERIYALLGRRPDFHEDGGDLLCGPLWHAQRQIRDFVDDPRLEATDCVTVSTLTTRVQILLIER